MKSDEFVGLLTIGELRPGRELVVQTTSGGSVMGTINHVVRSNNDPIGIMVTIMFAEDVVSEQNFAGDVVITNEEPRELFMPRSSIEAIMWGGERPE